MSCSLQSLTENSRLQYTGNNSYIGMQVLANYKSTTGQNVARWQAVGCTTSYAIICEKPTYDYRCDTVELPPEPPSSPFCAHGCFCCCCCCCCSCCSCHRHRHRRHHRNIMHITYENTLHHIASCCGVYDPRQLTGLGSLTSPCMPMLQACPS